MYVICYCKIFYFLDFLLFVCNDDINDKNKYDDSSRCFIDNW